MNQAEQIGELCERAIRDRVFPGCVVGYLQDGKKTVLPFGGMTYGEGAEVVKADTVYDVASITKSIPTACLALHLVELGLISLDDKLIDYVPEVRNEYRDRILIRHLLTYTVVFDFPHGLSKVARDHPDRIFEEIFTAPLLAPPGMKYAYTNAPAMLLGLVIERISNKPLNEYANDVFGSLPMRHTSFSTGYDNMQSVAPTEVDWRGEVRGVVHDETAWALRQTGRVAGHAGLFTTAADLLVFAKMLLNDGQYAGARYFMPETITMMHTNQLSIPGESTGMGWELRQALLPDGVGSDQVFGKTGFTGCVLVIDPKMKRAFSYVSNKTYPRRPKTREGIRAFRFELAKILFKQ